MNDIPVPTVEDVRFALWLGLFIGAVMATLVTICIRQTRKPPMARRTTYFAGPERTPDWKRPLRTR